MPEKAHVTSIEALDTFRSQLLTYVSRARPAVEDVSDEVIRMRVWLQSDRRIFWENQVRRRTKAMEDAQQALFSAGLAKLRSVTAAEQLAYNRAKRSVAEAQEKLKLVKQWSRDFDSRVGPMAKQLDQLRHILACDLPTAAAALAQTIKTLDAYQNMAPPSLAASGSTSPPPEPESATPAAGEAGGTVPAT
jgi:hypothetical protein